jgi:REP element-mobilizing transposase RayT
MQLLRLFFGKVSNRGQAPIDGWGLFCYICDFKGKDCKMARLNRQRVTEEFGGYHVISRVAGGDFLFKAEDKDYFLNLLRRFVSGYFVQLHSFAIMSNHFHLLVTVSEDTAAKADYDEIAHRLWTVNTGEFRKADDDENRQKMGMKRSMLQEIGLEKTRERLGSISRFVQDLKQSFARYFNQKHQRLGCLWGSRFKGVIISHGNAQLACSAYIDLNPVRAGLVRKPEDYRWCSLGLLKNNPVVAEYLLSPVQLAEIEKTPWEWYKSFVYGSGGIRQASDTTVAQEELAAKEKCRELRLDGKLAGRVRNLSEGLIAGTAKMIVHLQEKLRRKHRFARELWEGSPFFTTRVFHRSR